MVGTTRPTYASISLGFALANRSDQEVRHDLEAIPKLETADPRVRFHDRRRRGAARVESRSVRSAASAAPAAAPVAVATAAAPAGPAFGSSGVTDDPLASAGVPVERADNVGLDPAAGHVGDTGREAPD